VNRYLATLKAAFSLAVRNGKGEGPRQPGEAYERKQQAD
jgi:hypothetical protein